MSEPRSFEWGEVWVSPKGFLYRVMEVVPHGPHARPMAIMRSGYWGRGRLFKKWANDTKRWAPYFDTGSPQERGQPDTDIDQAITKAMMP